MIKVASLVLDCYDDTDGQVARGLPADVHACTVDAPDVIAQLADSQFGLVMKTASGLVRKFPLHTEDARKLSFAYYTKTSARLPEEARKMAEARMNNKVAVGYVDVTKLTPALKSAHKSPTKSASSPWGLTLNGKNHFPLHDEDLIKTALARFDQTTAEMAPEHTFMYARNLAARAAELKVAVASDSATRWYTNPTINSAALGHAIELRKSAAAGRCSTEILDQLLAASGQIAPASELEDPEVTAARRAKVASFDYHLQKPEVIVATLQAFDKLAGLGSNQYRRGLPDPFASCFREELKTAQKIIDGVDLDSIDPAMLTQMFAPDFVQEFQGDPVGTYKALPDPMRAAVRGLAQQGMGSSGVGKGEPTPAGTAGDAERLLDPHYSNDSTTAR